MIAHINGRLVSKSSDSVVIDVGGVGYEVFIPLSTYYKLPGTDQTVTLRTCTCLKNDSIELYGFLTHEERELFQMLIGVAGIGPRLARNILSGISVDEFVSSIVRGDVKGLGKVPGVGGKTAQRLVVELKDKVRGIMKESKEEKAPPSGREDDGLMRDVVSALKNMGYRSSPVEAAVKKARVRMGKSGDFEELFKASLRILASSR